MGILRMVESEQLPQQGTAWRTPRGCMGLWVPGPSLLVASFVGYGEAGFVAPILTAYRGLAHAGHLHLFFDAESLSNYDSAIRTELTAAFFPDRSRIGSLHVLVKSRLVGMGVSVANLALGGIVSSSTERASFKSKLEACLFENHVAGFSSRVLDALQPLAVEASG